MTTAADDRREAEVAKFLDLYRQMNADTRDRFYRAVVICLRDKVPMKSALGRVGLVQ